MLFLLPARRALGAAGLLGSLVLLPSAPVRAAGPAGGGAPPPPAVGVTTVIQRPVTSRADYIGRIQAIDRVALVPRVTAYLEQRLFDEGSEVKKGQLLYVLEQPPFQANVLVQQGALAQAQANVANAGINFQRQKALLPTVAGQKQSYDNALASARGDAAAVTTAQGNLQSAQIQLGYTEIRAPVDGRISATSVNQGNVVSPSSGTLATIVTQDPMYVVFPVATRDLLALQTKYKQFGGLGHAGITLTLGDGSHYDQPAHVDYVSPIVSNETDTITMRATVANPQRGATGDDGVSSRELVDGEFVTVTVKDPHPVESLVIPRAAVLSDQQGNYVFTVDGQNHARRVDVKLGESAGTDTVVTSGLSLGEKVIVDGLQKVHPGAQVTPDKPQPVVPDPDAAADLGSENPANAKTTANGHGGGASGGLPAGTGPAQDGASGGSPSGPAPGQAAGQAAGTNPATAPAVNAAAQTNGQPSPPPGGNGSGR